MVRNKIQVRHRLQGSTLIEVVVATVIITVCFLMFSVLLAKLYRARNINNEVRLLYALPYYIAYPTNTGQAIQQACPTCTATTSTQSNEYYTTQTTTITDTIKKRKLWQYKQVFIDTAYLQEN